jgi:hypothetical protein
MTQQKKDAVLITEEIVAELPLVVNVRKVTDLLTVPPMYQLSTFDTLHLRPGKDIVIDGKNYRVEAFTQDANLIVSGKTAADTEPPTGDFTVYAPHYVHGSPIITANKQQAKKLRADRIPFIWLYEILEEDRNTDPDNPFGLSYSARIFFMDESKLNDFSPKHYVDIIRPMMKLAEEFVNVIKGDNGKFNEVSEYKIIPHANFGKFTSDSGHTKQYFGENLSGVELKIDIEVERDACVDRSLLACTLDVTLSATSTNGGSDGTATANVINAKGNITFLWSDGQTTNPAIGLSAGLISVAVTDDTLPIPQCTASGSIEVVDYDDDAQVYFLAVEAVGTLTDIEKEAYNTWVTTRKLAGTYGRYTYAYPLMGGTAETMAINSITPGVKAITWFNTAGSDFQPTGWTANGSSYGDTGISPATDLVDNDAHGSAYSRTDNSSGFIYHFGSQDSVPSNFGLANDGSSVYSFIYTAASGRFPNGTVGTRKGYSVGVNRASNNREVYVDGVSIDADTQSGGTSPTTTILIGARSQNGTPASFSSEEYCFHSFGLAFSDAEAILEDEAMLTMQTAIGRQAP